MELKLSPAAYAAVKQQAREHTDMMAAATEQMLYTQITKKAAQERSYALQGLNVPDRYATLELTGLAAALEPQNAAVLRALLLRPVSCLLYGPVGTGKTSIACVVGRTWGVTAFVSFYDFAARLAALDYGASNALLVTVCDAPVLVIDDLGMADKSAQGALAAEAPKRIEIANQLIGHRHARNLPTIITSNLSLDLVGQQFGVRVESRMSEWLRASINGGDIRRRAQ